MLRRRAGVVLGTAFAGVVPGCVTELLAPEQPTGPIQQSALVIPVAGSGEAAVDAYYGSVLDQMRDALAGGDLGTLETLVRTHDRDDAPDWAHVPMQTFARAAAGLRCGVELRAAARLELVGNPRLGAPIDLEIQIAQVEGSPIVLGGARDAAPASFLLRFRIEDADAFGDRSARTHTEIVSLERRVALSTQELRAPVRIAIEHGAAVVREISAEVELLPGQVLRAGERVPHKRIALARARWTLYPQNYELVQKRPLATLQAALRLGSPALYGHVYLACRFLRSSARDREAALTALVRAVRVGDAALARVAGAGLALLTDERNAPGDREAWLAWWQNRPR